MRSTRSHEIRKRKEHSPKFDSFGFEGRGKAEKEDSGVCLVSTQDRLTHLSDRAIQKQESRKSRRSDGEESTQQVLLQQKIRIEELEKDLGDTKEEMERLRLYNQQLVRCLSSIYSQITKNPSSTFSSYLNLYAFELPYHRIEMSVPSELDSKVIVGHTSNDTWFEPTSNIPTRSQEESSKAMSKVERKAQSRYWTADEHKRFLEGLAKFGHKDMKAISSFVGTRNATQVRTHAQKYYLKLAREAARRQENQSTQLDSGGVGGASIKQRRSVVPVSGNACQKLVTTRNGYNEDHNLTSFSFESPVLDNRIPSSSLLNTFSLPDENLVGLDGIFRSANMCVMSFGQSSSFADMSSTLEGLSEGKSASHSDISPASCYDVEGIDTSHDRYNARIYEMSYSDANREGKDTKLDAFLESFPLENIENSWSSFEQLNGTQFSALEDFKESHDEKYISFSNSSMNFDNLHESAYAVVREN